MSTNTPPSATDGNADDNRGGDHDVLLAYLRGELSIEQTRELAQRLAATPALREELALLRATAEVVQADYVDATADAAFERLQGALGTAQMADKTPQSAPRARREPSLLKRMHEWMRSHAPALQPALLMLIVAQAGVLGWFIKDENRPVTEVPAATRGAGASCLDVWVTPSPDATVKGMRDWLLQYGGSIVAGPDAQGRFRITLPDAESRAAFTHDPARTRLTQSVDDAVQCGAGAASAP